MFLQTNTSFVSIQCRLIVAEMTATRSNGINILLYIFVPIQIISVYGVFMEQIEFIFLFLYNVIAILVHVHYGYCVVCCFICGNNCRLVALQVRQICAHLNIYAFKITNYSKKPTNNVDQR